MSSTFPPYKKWYAFGPVKGPRILVARLNNRRPRPIFRGRMMWQRARRGFSYEDAWSFHSHLEEVIGEGVAHLREIAHGYPPEITYDEWMTILTEIEQGMKAATYHAENYEWEEGGEAAFDLAMVHLRKWWFALWD